MISHAPPVELEGIHCSMEIRRPAPRVVVVTIEGSDVGELGNAPFRELESDLESNRPLDVFIDARKTRGASVDVSNSWALWFRRHKSQLRCITMLTGSQLIHITAEFVKRFAELHDRMIVTRDADVFESALSRVTS